MADRTYRWLLLSLAVLGLTADLASKYGVFRWLYKDGNFAEPAGNSREVVPGWFKLIAQFEPHNPTDDCPCQSWSAPVMPHVNRGALFGLGGSEGSSANYFFAGVSVLAAVAILYLYNGKRCARGRGFSKWFFYVFYPAHLLLLGMIRVALL